MLYMTVLLLLLLLLLLNKLSFIFSEILKRNSNTQTVQWRFWWWWNVLWNMTWFHFVAPDYHITMRCDCTKKHLQGTNHECLERHVERTYATEPRSFLQSLHDHWHDHWNRRKNINYAASTITRPRVKWPDCLANSVKRNKIAAWTHALCCIFFWNSAYGRFLLCQKAKGKFIKVSHVCSNVCCRCLRSTTVVM